MSISQTSTHKSSAPEPAAKKRWQAPHFGYRANRAMLWIGLRFLPLACAAVWLAALYFFLCVPKARRASIRYLDRIHPKKRHPLQRLCQTYRHMAEFGFLLLDRAIMLARPAHGFHMTCDGLTNLREALDQHHGLIMLSAHFGNAEAAAPYMAKMGLTRPIHLVMYQKPEDPTERFHQHYRRMLAGMEIISTTDPLNAGVKIMRALALGDIVAIRADRALDGRTLPATLLGHPVDLPAGPFLAAALSGAPVVQVYTCRQSYRRYTCIISECRTYGENSHQSADGQAESRDQRIARAAADYAAFLEKMLRRYPCQWSNFYDFWPNSPHHHRETAVNLP